MPAHAKKIVATTLPDEELAALDRAREGQHLSRAEIVRDAIRWYMTTIRHLPPAVEASPEEREAIRQGEEEFARGQTGRLEDVLHELER